MGKQAVVSVLTDYVHEIAADENFGKVIRRAVLDYPDDPHFWAHGIQVISRDHSSGYQVTVCHGNTGWRISLNGDAPPPQDVEQALIDAVKGLGYRVSKRKPAPA